MRDSTRMLFQGETLPVEIGELVGEKYRIERVVGIGGMAAVLAAHHVGLKRDVAIKILLPRFTRHAEVGPRFEREGLAAASLKSPHVVQVMDVGKLPNGDTYLVMELLAGTDLAEVIREKAPLPVAEAVQYLLDACDAIEEAHSLKIIHRDLKPANLFCIAKTGSRRLMVKVLDFGISKAPVDNHSTDVKTTMGTPPYMAPEQFQSAKSADARSDIWALGVILYECLTGVLPFQSAEFVPLALEIAKAPHPPVRGIVPGLSQTVEDVITKCLAKDPADRFQDVTSLISALTALLEKPKKSEKSEKSKKSEPVETVIDEVIATPEPKPKRRNMLGIVVAAGCGAILLAWVFAREPNPVEKQVASAAPSTSPKELAAKCEVTLEVTDVPLRGQVLLRMGQTPVDVQRLPVGTRVELVATAEGYSPRRAVIPADAAWIDGRLDLALQLSPTKVKPGSVDPWPVAEPGAQPGGSGSRGVAHVTSNVGGSEVWLLAGAGPEARIEHLPCTADIDVLVAGPPQLRTRLQVTVKDIEAAGNYSSSHRLLRISTLPPTPGTDEGLSLSELLFKADDAHRGGHSLRAKHFYEGALKKSPENLDALTSLGDMAQAEGDLARAKAMHSKAVAAKPGFRPALLGLADAEWDLGEKDAAQKHYAEYVRSSSGPGSPARAIERAKSQ